jgi:hypothetical protein
MLFEESKWCVYSPMEFSSDASSLENRRSCSLVGGIGVVMTKLLLCQWSGSATPTTFFVPLGSFPRHIRSLSPGFFMTERKSDRGCWRPHRKRLLAGISFVVTECLLISTNLPNSTIASLIPYLSQLSHKLLIAWIAL